MPGENASKLLASLSGKEADKPSNRRKLIAGLRAALKGEDDDKLGEAMDAYVGDFLDETDED